ncbi:heparinase II/III family protein [Streptococcus sp. NLN64]|uniref:heparinase II/III domain-containing protein n=1 Tax=Streptococcus sp. NLN64 TaxID=2822799 RepID=UPI0018C9DD13|nr:heparinase II/III family protein [Streptococcus sp. NLN64]MBG9367373.1 alginate lyase family protein [Streptococcus sp. NLN64]
MYSQSVLEILEQGQQPALKSVLKSAKLLLENIFVFDDNWDMEPCLIPYRLSPLRWDMDCHGDEEWLFMLNRQEYLWKLGLAFQLSGDSSYLEKIKDFMESWIAQVQEFSPKDLRCRTMDTAIRCISWSRVIPLLRDNAVIDDEEYYNLLQSLKNQLTFLKSNYRPKDTLSNWGIFQTVAILLVDYVFGNEVTLESERQFADAEILTQVQTQILEDGTQFEQSFLYHVEVFQLLLELAYRIPKYAVLLSDTLRKMGNYVLWMTGPDGHNIAVGDSDIHALHDVLQFAAIVLEDANYLLDIPDIRRLDLKVLFLVGEEGLDTFQGLIPVKPPQGGKYFSEIGHSLIREEDSLIFFKAGPMGSGHSHSDQNQLCLYHRSKPIFIDPGRYTYRECRERYFLKSSLAHNVCLLDDVPSEQIENSWSYHSYPYLINHTFKSRKDCHLLQGVYQAQLTNGSSFWHERQVLSVGADLIFLFDILDCSGEHTLRTQFVLSPDLNFLENKIGDLQIYSEKNFVLTDSLYSPRYNQLEATSKIVRQESFQDHLATVTVIAEQGFTVKKVPVFRSNQELFPHAKAFSCKRTEDEDYLILFQDREIYRGEKLLVVDGVKLRGKCIVYNRKTKEIRRLRH